MGFKSIIIAIVLALALYGAVALGQKTYKEYIIPKIETENKSLKTFEKVMRETVNDLSRRLEKGNL